MSDLKYYFVSAWIDPSNGDIPNVVELFVVTDEPAIDLWHVRERIKTQHWKPKRVSIINLQKIDAITYKINVTRPRQAGLRVFNNESNFDVVTR